MVNQVNSVIINQVNQNVHHVKNCVHFFILCLTPLLIIESPGKDKKRFKTHFGLTFS